MLENSTTDDDSPLSSRSCSSSELSRKENDNNHTDRVSSTLRKFSSTLSGSKPFRREREEYNVIPSSEVSGDSY